MLNLLRCDCGSPSCVHPKPTLYDWYSLAYCLYPRTVTVVTFVAKGLALLLAVLLAWLWVVIVFSADIDPFYG